MFGYIFNFKKINYSFEWYYRYKEIVGKKPTREEFRNQKDYEIFSNRGLLSLFEIIWIFFGLVTNKWYYFLSILISVLLINFGLEKWRFSAIDNIIRFLFIVFRCVLYITLIIQHFHY